jgi:hypothetical protein
MTNMYAGSCICGAIQFEVTGELGAVEACHCLQCRKWTGHFLASTEVARQALSIEAAENIAWHQFSDKARRGFCPTCGASLFFDPIDKDKHNWIGISMGAFDSPTNTKLAQHIFVAEKGDYYEISDGLPQNEH